MFVVYMPYRRWLQFRGIAESLYPGAQVGIDGQRYISVRIPEYLVPQPDGRLSQSPGDRIVSECARAGLFVICASWIVLDPSTPAQSWTGEFTPVPAVDARSPSEDMYMVVQESLVQEFLHPELPPPDWMMILGYFQNYRRDLGPNITYLEALVAGYPQDALNFRRIEVAHVLASFIGQAVRMSDCMPLKSDHYLRLAIWQKLKRNDVGRRCIPALLHALNVARSVFRSSPPASLDESVKCLLSVSVAALLA